MDLNKLSKSELLQKCKELEITKYKFKNKAELIEIINNKINTNKNNYILEQNIKHETKKIYIKDNITIINNDCLIELNKLEDNSIDCVITDPPYFINKLDNKWCANNINNDIKNSHITHLPKGMKFDKD